MNEMRRQKCVVCGEWFTTTDWRRKTCSKYCQIQNTANTQKKNDEKRKHKRRADEKKKKRKSEVKQSSMSIMEITCAAREAGMSYGQYVAEMYKEELKGE